MGDARVICLLCRARQSVQVAVRRGALVGSGSSGNSGNSSSSISSTAPQPIQRRWNTTTNDDRRGGNTESWGGGGGGGGGYRTARRRQHSVTPEVLPRRSRPSQASNDSALSVFQDIVGEQGQFEHLRRARNADREGLEAKEDADEGDDVNIEWAKLEHAARMQAPSDHQVSQGRVTHLSKSLYDDVVRLVQMGSQADTTIVDVFAHFETTLLPGFIRAGPRLPQIFRQTSEKMMYEVSMAKRRDFLDPALPSVARITEIRRQLGLLSTPRTWLALVLELSEKILLTYQASLEKSLDDSFEDGVEQSANAPLVEDPAVVDQRQRLTNELIGAWRIFILPDVVTSDPGTLAGIDEWEFRMPKPDPELMAKYAQQNRPELAIASLFPRYAPQQLQNALPAVLATYAVLVDSAIADEATKKKAREFITSVRAMLDILNIDRRVIGRIFGERKHLAKYMVDRWPLDGPQQDFHRNRAMRIKRSKWALNFKSIHGQVGNALRTRSLQICEDAWEQFWAAITSPDYQGSVRLVRAESLFDYFIMVFTTLRTPERAIAVWNLMATVGIEPTLNTWTSFMEGCKQASDPNGINTIWEKLVASGIEIDTAAWTARISGLIRSGETEAGIKALQEMQTTWEAWSAAENKKPAGASPKRPKAVKPTIEPVNATIVGLIRKGDMQGAKRVLAWAGQHGINPNVMTFNTILHPLMREGRVEESGALLDVMRKQGIQADEGTVTILLEATLGNGAMVGRNSEEQAELVKQVLAEIEAAGIEANQMTYGKIIYLLLAGGMQSPEQRHSAQSWGSTHIIADNDKADEAVRVVLDRMRQRNVPLSPHIYTILVQHYFALNPPDLVAIKSLIETGDPTSGLRNRDNRDRDGTEAAAAAEANAIEDVDVEGNAKPAAFNQTVLDRVFWERVVRGFSQLGDTASALVYFKNIEDSLSLTSSMLEDLLRALINNNEWEAAQQLVAKVRKQKMYVAETGGLSRGRPGELRVFRHRFWHLALEHGL